MENINFTKTPLLEDEVNRYVTSQKGQISSKRSVRDLFLENDFEDAEVFYPSRINNTFERQEVEQNEVQPFFMPNNQIELRDNSAVSQTEYEISPFILANTSEVSLEHLSSDCIIPSFSKDNERTISHNEFIEGILETVSTVFPNQSLSAPEIRVSHQIKGRIPSAIHKNVKDLMEDEKTIYYERMAFIVKVNGITDVVSSDELVLSVGGVRAYNQENLYGKKTLEKFRFFIGFQNKICCNMCVSTDGFLEDLRASTIEELQSKALEVMQNYDAELHLMEMKELTQEYLTEHQFAQLIGKSRLYQHLPKLEKQRIPELNFNDGHINTIAKDYYEDQNFSRLEDGRINLWDVYNLFTQANKSSYIDTFLDRNLNAFEFSKGLQKTVNGDENYHWFLS